jgi:hypothetical protein
MYFRTCTFQGQVVKDLSNQEGNYIAGGRLGSEAKLCLFVDGHQGTVDMSFFVCLFS